MASTPRGPTNRRPQQTSAWWKDTCLDTGFGKKKSFTKRFRTKPYIDDLLHGTPDRDNSERSEKLSRLCIEDHERQLRDLFEILTPYKLSLKPKRCIMFTTRLPI